MSSMLVFVVKNYYNFYMTHFEKNVVKLKRVFFLEIKYFLNEKRFERLLSISRP
jgi:hypothetical protein